jgi:hypothetical protein
MPSFISLYIIICGYKNKAPINTEPRSKLIIPNNILNAYVEPATIIPHCLNCNAPYIPHVCNAILMIEKKSIIVSNICIPPSSTN